MKTKILFITSLILLGTFCSNAQNRNKTKDLLVGDWNYCYKESSENILVYEKDDDTELIFGHYLIFSEEESFTVGCSAQCGNDPNIYSKNGTWEFDLKNKTLTFNIDVMERGKEFKIIEITEDKLKLEAI